MDGKEEKMTEWRITDEGMKRNGMKKYGNRGGTDSGCCDVLDNGKVTVIDE